MLKNHIKTKYVYFEIIRLKFLGELVKLHEDPIHAMDYRLKSFRIINCPLLKFFYFYSFILLSW